MKKRKTKPKEMTVELFDGLYRLTLSMPQVAIEDEIERTKILVDEALAASHVDEDSDSYDRAQRLSGYLSGLEYALKQINRIKRKTYSK